MSVNLTFILLDYFCHFQSDLSGKTNAAMMTSVGGLYNSIAAEHLRRFKTPWAAVD